MSLEADLQTLLKAQTSIAVALGENPRAGGDRAIRRERLFQSDVLPAIEIHIEDAGPVNTLEGHNGTFNSHVVLACLALDQGIAAQIAAAVVAYLEPFTGATATGFVESVTYLSTRNNFVAYVDGTDDGEHVSEVHLRIWYIAD